MKTQKLFILAFIVISAFAVSSCKKSKTQGCTTSSASNYNSSAEEDDGSCTYKGDLVFWWKQALTDSCNAHGIVNIKAYIDGTFEGTLSVSTQSWSSALSCGASSTVTSHFDFGKSKTKNINMHFTLLDGSGNTIATGDESKTLNSGCNDYELTW